jgi:hypothetical protein
VCVSRGATVEHAVKTLFCASQVETLKRCCLKELPSTLVLHLKRFELDYVTFQKKKINSYCVFNKTLDMFPFTATGMAQQDAAAGEARRAQNAATQGMTLCRLISMSAALLNVFLCVPCHQRTEVVRVRVSQVSRVPALWRRVVVVVVVVAAVAAGSVVGAML